MKDQLLIGVLNTALDATPESFSFDGEGNLGFGGNAIPHHLMFELDTSKLAGAFKCIYYAVTDQGINFE